MATDKKGELLLTEIPDHPLTEILLRLPTPEDLARACAACSTFRRIATDSSFRRRFLRLHAPPLLGFLDCEGFHPPLPPHPSAPAARALARIADFSFSFSFLPSHCSWTVRDVRDGRVLLACDPDPHEDEQPPVFADLVVCDPLHQRYNMLPPVPDDLAASVEDPDPVFFRRFCEPSLIPRSEEEAAAVEETAFRVIWFAQSNIKVYILIFSSSTRQWRAAASQGLTDLLTGKSQLTMITPQHPLFREHYYACGCVYWKWKTNERWKRLLVLDTRRMEFSIADLPLEAWDMADIAIVEAGEDKLGLFGLRDEFEGILCYMVGQKQGENLSHWQAEKTISLDYSYQHCIRAATGRYLLLEGEEDLLFRCLGLVLPNMEYFSLDVRHCILRVFGVNLSRLAYQGHTYIPTCHHRCCLHR